MNADRETESSFDVVSILAVNSLDFIEQIFACYDSGTMFSVTKPDSDMAGRKGITVTDVRHVAERHGWGRYTHRPLVSDAPAQIVFTSGTEGRAKAIVLSAGNLADVVVRLNAVMQVDDTIREYIGVPVTYSFGLGRARAVSAAGGAFYLPERFDPIEIVEMLGAGEINAISAVPSLWRIVLANPDIFLPVGARVRWIEIGSQYMSKNEKEEMKRLFPNARIVQHYGLTEASRTTFLVVSDATGDQLESVGTAEGATEVAIDEEGAIRIRGPHVALGVIDAQGHLVPLVDADGWITTRDRGLMDGRYLWFLGRLDDQINVSGVKLAAEQLELEIREQLNGETGFAITGVSDPLRGEAVLLAIEPAARDKRALLVAAAELILKRHGVDQAGALKIAEPVSLPVTETGKIQRRKLREDFEAAAPPDEHLSALAQDVEHAVDLTAREKEIASAWRQIVGAVPVNADASFYDLGGDSLAAIQLGLAMQRSFSIEAIRATLEGRTLREVAGVQDSADGIVEEATFLASLPDKTIKTWSLNIARGLMVISVLISHWGPGLFVRLGLDRLADQYLGFIYRAGTPGFSTIFGVGMGYFMLHGYRDRRASVDKRLRSLFLLVFAVLLTLAGFACVLDTLDGPGLTQLRVAQSFYGVLTFYVIALATGPLWIRALSQRRNPPLWAAAVAIMLWPLSLVVEEFLPPWQIQGFLELPRLLLSAHYNVLHMGATVLGGVAVGYWLVEAAPEKAGPLLLKVGLAGAILMVTLGLDVHGLSGFRSRAGQFFDEAMGYSFYFFLVLLLVGCNMWLTMRFSQISPVARIPLQMLIVFGGLALPIFVFHGYVIPIKNILVYLGVPEGVALLLPLGAFLAFIIYGSTRLHRMYFR